MTWRPGASDWRVWDVTAANDVPLFACPRLHAKLYVADDKALIGSANATRPGLGMGAESNLEVLLEVDANAPTIQKAVATVCQESAPASPIGPDVTEVRAGIQEDGAVVPIWLPKSDPVSFLWATVGQLTDDDRDADVTVSTLEFVAVRLRHETRFERPCAT